MADPLLHDPTHTVKQGLVKPAVSASGVPKRCWLVPSVIGYAHDPYQQSSTTRARERAMAQAPAVVADAPVLQVS